MSQQTKIKENIAYYLPQFHCIPENDLWWGKDFTEWVQVKAARKYFKGHEILQPEDGNYYDLSDVSVIEKQYKLAREHSITGFCMWHYWFGNGDKLLEKPAELILNSNIEVRYCFGWANHSWWNKKINKLLKEQTYPGKEDQIKHIEYLLPFFKDERYIKINGKPLFLIFKVYEIPDAKNWLNNFREIAKSFGIKDLYIIGEFSKESDIEEFGLDAVVNSRGMFKSRSFIEKVRDKLIHKKIISEKWFSPRKYSYSKLSKGFNEGVTSNKVLPVIIPRWDSTIRHGKNGWLLQGSTPISFEKHVKDVKHILEKRKFDDRIVIIKSWNEWAEGNFIEPDNINGRKYLDIIKKELTCND
ncbi:glycoside hydrolase family 99-like domain-containing protein [Lelliottia amnigena]|uniref:glycosyltransferase WbsX family protein n=1 Tax=Lelliottia amnigena TaxID=61646 RepID=UPI00192BF7E1|nr:glycoside hydrolase family 99-like domain-containing protein [Lelliottia amnigena]MBL5922237.1 glycoside hydrolase family 99-like domain-containing protein [Lelliottia amnigena]MBL5964022.1 glycoside hydrolase family 99-like domain-containing protein [Lelliottia amnigena]